MSRKNPQVNFRIPSELKAKLEHSAKEQNRSITAELISRLESSFGTHKTDAKLGEILELLRNR